MSAGIVALIVLTCYQQEVRGGVWRVSFGIGFVVSARHSDLGEELADIMLNTASTCYLLLPNPHDQFDPIPQTCDQVTISILARFEKILEADARNL